MDKPDHVSQSAAAVPEEGRAGTRTPADRPLESFSQLALEVQDEQKAKAQAAPGVGTLFSQSFGSELNRYAHGAAQIAGADKYLPELSEPEEATDSLGQHAQMAGRGLAGLLPMVGMAVASRFGMGKLLGHDAAAAENLILKRSPVGLNIAESAGTGFLVGSLLTPTDAAAQQDWTSFVGDRLRSGTTSAAAFSVMTASSLGFKRLASTELASRLMLDGVMKSAAVNGIVSGIPGGIANVEFDSLARTGTISYDREKLGKSMYEMSFFGGTFGTGSRFLEKRSETSNTISRSTQNSEPVRNMQSSESTVPIEPIRIPHSSEPVLPTQNPEPVRIAQSPESVPASQQHEPIGTAQNPKLTDEHAVNQTVTLSKEDAFKQLDERFGSNSLTMLHLRMLDGGQIFGSTGISDIATFIGKNQITRGPLVEQVLAEATTPKPNGGAPEYLRLLTPDRLEGLEKLQKALGPDSSLLKQILKIEDGNHLTLASLGSFVESSPASRVPIIKRTIENGFFASDLSIDRLESLEKLIGHFGEQSPVTETFRRNEINDGSFSLPELSKYIEQDPVNRTAKITQLVAQGAADYAIDGRRLNALDDVTKHFGEDSPVLMNLLQAEAYARGDIFPDVARFIQENPERGPGLVAKAAVDHNGYRITYARLSALDALEHKFGLDKQQIDQLVTADWVYQTALPSVVAFLETNPQENIKHLERAVTSASEDVSHGLSGQTDLSSILDSAKRSEALGQINPIVPYLESIGADAHDVAGFVAGDPAQANRVLDLLKQGEGDSYQYRSEELSALKLITEFSDKYYPELAARLPEAIRRGLSAENLRLYLNGGSEGKSLMTDSGSRTEAGIAKRVESFIEAIDAGASGNQLAPHRLNLIDQLTRVVDVDHAERKRLFDLDRNGLDIAPMVRSIERSPEAFAPLLHELLKSTEPYDGVANPYSKLVALVRDHSNDKVTIGLVNSLFYDHFNTRSAEQLLEFIEENPKKRVQLIAESLEEPGSIYVSRLRGLEHLKEQLQNDTPVFKRILELEKENNDFSLSATSEFISENPEKNGELVKKIIMDGGTATDLDPHRLSGLRVLFDVFGESSDTTKYLLRLEKTQYYPIGEVARFLQEYPEKADSIQTKALRQASYEELDPEQLGAIAQLEKLMGENSPRMNKILQSAGTDSLSDMAYLLRDKTDLGMLDTDAAARQRFVENEIDAEIQYDAQQQQSDKSHAPADRADKLQAARLESLYELERAYGEKSKTVETLRRLEDTDAVAVLKIGNFLIHNRAEHAPFLAKLVSAVEQASQDKITVSHSVYDDLDHLYVLDKNLNLDQPHLLELLKLESRGLGLGSLASLVEESPSSYVPLIRDGLENKPELWKFDGQRLRSIARLGSILGRDSAAMKQILHSEASLDLGHLQDLVQIRPDIYKPLIAQAIEDGGGKLLDPFRLQTLVVLDRLLTDRPELKSKLLKLESSGAALAGIDQFMDSTESIDFVQSMIDNNIPGKYFEVSLLKLRYLLEKPSQLEEIAASEVDPAAFLSAADQVVQFAATNHSARDIHAFIAAFQDPTLMEKKVNLLNRLINIGAPEEMFSYHSLNGFLSLNESLSGTRPNLERQLVELAEQGMNLSDAAAFVRASNANQQLFSSLLSENATADKFTKTSLIGRKDATTVAANFDATEASAILSLHDNGLSASRLKNFIAQEPEGHTAIVRQLIKDGADVRRFNQQMSLSVLPAKAAYALIDASVNGGMRMPEILHNLKDFRIGSQFRELIINHVDSGKSLDATALQALVTEAKLNWQPRKLDAPASTTPQVADDYGTIPDILNDSTKNILDQIPPEKNIVVLGRDMAAIFPRLRAARPNVQYFLWSSIQEQNSTARQWLKEVAPGSAVIDTGFAGSIIDQIRQYDSTVSGYLLSTDVSSYPALMQHDLHRGRVERIEQLPKLIGRSKSFTENGNAVSRSTEREGTDVQKYKSHESQSDRWDYERETRATFEAMGLPAWDAWRYSQFTGLTARERLGLSNESEVQAHYRRIEHERKIFASPRQ